MERKLVNYTKAQKMTNQIFVSYLAENQIFVLLAPVFGANDALILSCLLIHHRFATATAKAFLGVG